MQIVTMTGTVEDALLCADFMIHLFTVQTGTLRTLASEPRLRADRDPRYRRPRWSALVPRADQRGGSIGAAGIVAAGLWVPAQLEGGVVIMRHSIARIGKPASTGVNVD
jgi:hypothetical protein